MKKIFLILLLITLSFPVYARPIIANISIKSIHIDTNFRGINILLFGAREDAGNIVVVVRGPEKDYIIRKKERVLGMWVNTQQREFEAVPGFYAIGSSRQLDKIDNERLLKSLGIGIENLDWKTNSKPEKDDNIFSNALLEKLQKNRLYPVQVEKVSFWGETLFQTNISFPSTIPDGKYSVEVYLFSDGELSAVQTMPLTVKKVGFEAFVHDVATRHPAFYGIIAVLMAIITGWIGSRVFRKV